MPSSITKSFFQFFKELEQNNQREWFQENRKRYEQQVKAPFTALVQEVIDKMFDKDPTLLITPSEAIFRINRDIRFSADKSPYKLHMGAVVGRGGKKDTANPAGIYFEIGAKGLSLASGVYMPDKQGITNIRDHMAANPERFAKIIQHKKLKDTWGSLQGEQQKRVPAEYKEALEKNPLIANKQFYLWKEYKQKEALQEDLAAFIVQHYEIARPLTDFLSEALKAR